VTGIGISEAVFLSAKHPATFLVFSPKKPFVSLGRFQAPESGFYSALKSEGIGVVRRPRSGGQLLHTSSQIVFSSIMKGDPDAVRKVVLEGVLMVLEQLGMRGNLEGLTGVTVGGRRICEYTISSDRGFTQVFGVLLLGVDYDLMSRLAETREELRHAEKRRLVSLVTSVENEIGALPSAKDTRKALVASTSISAGLRTSKGRLSLRERRELTKVLKTLSSKEWLNQQALAHPSLFEESFKPKQATLRSEAGLLSVALRISDNTISEIGFSGSFTFYPEEKLVKLEASLKGCSLSEAELVESLSMFYLKEGVRSPGISPLDLAYTILKASFEA
jgi:lipoate-protein ligase A